MTDLGDHGGETAIRSIRRTALAIRAKEFLLPEQKWIDGDVHARPVDDMFSEHMTTHQLLYNERLLK